MRKLLSALLLVGSIIALQPERAQEQSAELVDAYRRGLSLREAGRYGEAVPYWQKALALGERELGSEKPITAALLNNLAELYQDIGRYAEAEPLYRRAIAIGEKTLGPEHPKLATRLNNLASLYWDTGRYGEAEPLYRRAIAIGEKTLGAEHPELATRLNNLAALYEAVGRYAEAEPLYRRAIAIGEKTLGPEHPDLATWLNNLAGLYWAAGRYGEAEPLLRRAIAIGEKTLGAEHPELATRLNNLAVLYRDTGRYGEAEPLLRRAIAIREKTLGPEHPDVAQSPNNLGELYRAIGRYGESEPLLRRAIAIGEKTLGPEHPKLATRLNNLAELYKDTGRYAEAEPLHERALAIHEKVFGPEHPGVATSLNNLAGLYRATGRYAEAITFIRKATRIHRTRAVQPAGQAKAGITRTVATDEVTFRNHARIGWEFANQDPEQRAGLLDETFQSAQLARTSDTAAAVARMAARFAAADDALATLIREQQDLVQRWQALDTTLTAALSHPPAERNRAGEEQLRQELGSVDSHLDAIARELAERFPNYAELVSPEPAGVGEIQGLLRENEALLAYLVLEDATFVWVVRRGRAEMYRHEIGRAALDDLVRRLRAQLDPGQTDGALLEVDLALAHALYRELFPAEPPILAGGEHLFIVPDRPLQSLPFGVLVRTPPEEGRAGFARYREVDWLIRHHPLTTLPSVSSLRALRRFARPSRAGEPFVGVGDPLLKGHPAAGTRVAVAGLFTPRGVADVEAIRNLPPLPEAADELQTLARTLGATDGSLLLRERATEQALKERDLSGTRVVAFATHAGVAGEIPSVAEPALVLTPPEQASETDDGVLTASEAARLKLDADFVILSACNTAAPDGTPGAEGLSGLAKAFIYAGARSLLVSHWLVDSDAAVRLTTGMFAELARDPTLGRAEALRRSMLALMADNGRNYFPHPMAWAPFVVVGEGGPLNTPLRASTGRPTEPAVSPRLFRTVTNANVRNGPSTKAATLAELPRGAHVKVVGEDASGAWRKVVLDDSREGYVRATLLEPSP